MAQKINYLLGFGERLVDGVVAPQRSTRKKDVYSYTESRDRLLPQLESTVNIIESLPANVCPRNQAVISVTLHPSYISKTVFPDTLLSTFGLYCVGSRERQIKPIKWNRKGDETIEMPSLELFIAGERQFFDLMLKGLRARRASNGLEDFIKIEQFRVLEPQDKVRPFREKEKAVLSELVLHTDSEIQDDIVERFYEFLYELEISADPRKRLTAPGLCFVPALMPQSKASDVAKFTFLRVARQMPALNRFQPMLQSGGYDFEDSGLQITLPETPALDRSIRAAIFDGGLPEGALLNPWVTYYEPPGVGVATEYGSSHGLAVTSASLFGSINTAVPLPTPYANIDHYCITGDEEYDDDDEERVDLIEILNRISGVLKQGNYEFANLSVGPDIAIEDNDPHAWTTTIDEIAASGKTLICSAVGNNGEGNPEEGFNRIQPPSDCVNVLSVGACDTEEDNWNRASYSCVGPGRSPGFVKPDLLTFGGDKRNPFLALGFDNGLLVKPTSGTSFASPNAMRMAMGIRAYLGNSITPLALRALLIHHATNSNDLSQSEVGWGRLPLTAEEMIICPDNTAHIVYQGILKPKEWVRAQIPLPLTGLKGEVTIKATFCFASRIDPHHPSNYTQDGLEVVFRPHSGKFAGKIGPTSQPKSDSFFGKSRMYSTEIELRHNAHKWETILKAERTKKSHTLQDACFDVHYIPRAQSHDVTRGLHPISYGLVVSVCAPKVPDLYDKIFTRYRGRLQAMQPVIELPIQI